ncbi:MAG: type IIL restriction-modification enzyme MmeI [Tepidisphaeraceae bacterium]
MLAWFGSPTVPDCAAFAFARADDYFFGVLHSAIHELWALRMGTQLEDRPRYTPTTCFETFPLPWPPGKENVKHAAYRRISEAAKELNERRERWLNPLEWIEPIAADIDAKDKFEDVPKEARALIRQSAVMAAAAKDARLKKRTLTNLYNERPTWLKLAHETLDRAVLAAYAAVDPGPSTSSGQGNWDEDWAEVWTESGAGQPLAADHPLSARRREVDQLVLSNLLRLNHLRAAGK